MLDYPDALPLPDYDSYAFVVSTGLQRTDITASLANQLQSFNSPRTQITMTFSMSNAVYAFWNPWVQANAYQWFNLPVIAGYDPAEILSSRQARFMSDLQYTKRGDNWLSVSVAVELLPGQP